VTCSRVSVLLTTHADDCCPRCAGTSREPDKSAAAISGSSIIPNSHGPTRRDKTVSSRRVGPRELDII